MAKAITLRLHLQKHYLLKNYTSPDLEILLDEKETYVQLTPKDDGDALRMLRASDTQIASKYRSFLTFIRCELTLVFNPIVNYERARLLAQKNMLTIEPIKRAGSASAASSASAQQQQRYLITGTLARTKSFISELYRMHGQDRDGADGATNGDEVSPRGGSSSSLSSSSSNVVSNVATPTPTVASLGSSSHSAARPTSSAATATSTSTTTTTLPYATVAANAVAAASNNAAAAATGSSLSSSAAASAANLALLRAVPLVECVVALLARNEGDQLIGTLVIFICFFCVENQILNCYHSLYSAMTFTNHCAAH